MSVSDKEISSVEVTSGGSDDRDRDDGVDEDDDEEKSGGVHQKHYDHDDGKVRGRGYGAFSGVSRNLGKAKKFVLTPFNRKLSRKSKSSASGKRLEFHGGGGAAGKSCFYCFRPNPSEESGIGSHSSDPNDPAFTYDMLRVLMENSDFYSKECNTHLDSDIFCSKD